jgi:hypothetical protein
MLRDNKGADRQGGVGLLNTAKIALRMLCSVCVPAEHKPVGPHTKNGAHNCCARARQPTTHATARVLSRRTCCTALKTEKPSNNTSTITTEQRPSASLACACTRGSDGAAALACQGIAGDKR